MPDPATSEERSPIGQSWLRRELGLAVPRPAVESYIVAGAWRTEADGSRIVELYPRQYAADGTAASHLRFALRHELVDLGVLVAALKTIDPGEIEVDMPDRRASLFVRLCIQNAGRLSAAKRRQFPELDDAEVAAMEAAVQDAMREDAQGR